MDDQEQPDIKSPFLPVPYTEARREESDWLQFRERHRRQLIADPAYDAWWRRPSEEVATAVWDAVTYETQLDIDAFLTTLGRKQQPEELIELRARARQALVVTIDAAVASCEKGHLLTANSIFDALASRWSDWYRRAITQTDARSSYDLRRQTAKNAARDLLVQGLWLAAFVGVAQQRSGVGGIYRTEEVWSRGKLGPRSGCRVILADAESKAWQRYKVARGQSPRQSDRARILLANDPQPTSHDQYEVAAESRYDEVPVGPQGRRTIERLQATRLLFRTNEFEADYAGAMSKNAKDKYALRAIAQEVEDLRSAGKVPADGIIEIKTAVYMTRNRRYEVANFWPEGVKGGDEKSETISSSAFGPTTITRSRRLRWFLMGGTGPGAREGLRGVDMSASQLQLLAVFAGLRGMETTLSNVSWKRLAVDAAWALHRDKNHPFVLPDPGRAEREPKLLEESLKHAGMTHVYGNGLGAIAAELDKEPDDFVPLGNAVNLRHLLYDDRLLLRPALEGYRAACQRLAEIAYKKDSYAGVVLTDPLDSIRYRRTPWLLSNERVAGSGVRVYASVPQSEPNEVGLHRVDRRKLLTTIGPCLIHSLDGLFASFVIEELSSRDVQCVSIHDCWLVGWSNELALHESIKAAERRWLLALGPVYADLERYLADDPKHGPWVTAIRKTWSDRLENGDWPKFRYGPVAPEVQAEVDGVTFTESMSEVRSMRDTVTA